MTAEFVKLIPSSKKIAPLLRDARIGSAEALGQLLAAYRPFLLAIATEEFNSDLKAKAGPSDVVQETFIDAQRDFAKFTSDTASHFRFWLHAILMNNLADLRRRYLKAASRQVRRERPLGLANSKNLMRDLADGDGHSPARIAMSRETQTRINAALDRLRPAFRQVIILRNQRRQTFVEIGNLLGKSPDAARMLWQRAILKLRAELKDDNDGE